MELLAQGRDSEAADLVVEDRRAVRHLVGRLWDRDAAVRAGAARALGRAAAAHPGLGTDLIRRLMWGLNDESATNGVYGIPALGEIGRHAPKLMKPFVPSLASLARDDALREAVIDALRAVASSAPWEVGPLLADVERWVDGTRPSEIEAFRRLASVARGTDDDHVE